MAKLKINELNAEISVDNIKTSPAKHSINLSEELDELKFNMIAVESSMQRKLDEMDDHLMGLMANMRDLSTKVETPIVKEIKLDKTNADDLEHLEKSMKKTIDSLNAARKSENIALARAFAAQDRYQTAINFVVIIALLLVIFAK